MTISHLLSSMVSIVEKLWLGYWPVIVFIFFAYVVFWVRNHLRLQRLYTVTTAIAAIYTWLGLPESLPTPGTKNDGYDIDAGQARSGESMHHLAQPLLQIEISLRSWPNAGAALILVLLLLFCLL